MSDEKPIKPIKPGVTEEIPTLRKPAEASSDQAPTPQKPHGKVILGGAAAEDAVTARRPDAGTTEAGEPVVALPAAGSRVGRTLPSEDDDVVPTRAAPTRVDIVAPDGTRAPAAHAPVRAASAPRSSGGAGGAVLIGGLLALVVLGGVGAFAFYSMRSHSGEEQSESEEPSKPTATATEAPAAAPEPTTAPAPTETVAPTPTPTDSAAPVASPTTTPGTKPTTQPSGTSSPTAAPSYPSWIPTAMPTGFPTAIPSTFPFPTAFPTAPPK